MLETIDKCDVLHKGMDIEGIGERQIEINNYYEIFRVDEKPLWKGKYYVGNK